MKEILVQPIQSERKKIESSFKRLDPDSDYKAERIVYYPYYYFIYNVKAKRLFLPANEQVGCTVDAVSGKGSLIDSHPKLKQLSISEEQLLDQKHSLEECLAVSKSFLFRSISLKMRMLSISNVKVEKKKLFYRPYWVVFNKTANNDNPVHFIVDAVTGQYHPLA